LITNTVLEQTSVTHTRTVRRYIFELWCKTK